MAEKIGFTEIETKVVIFILSAFVFGLAVYFFQNNNAKTANVKFSYKQQDSLFDIAKKISSKKQIIVEKGVDSKQELLDFSNHKKKSRNKSEKSLTQKSININTANVSTLVLLPGIGKVTANGIIAYRQKVKHFKTLNELMNVKGIGKKKLNKIKKYLKIEE